MKKLKVVLVSFALGLVLSISTVAVLAQCPQMIIVHGQHCSLAGENCGSDVCVCAYICE
jgi:hypothetical protein